MPVQRECKIWGLQMLKENCSNRCIVLYLRASLLTGYEKTALKFGSLLVMLDIRSLSVYTVCAEKSLRLGMILCNRRRQVCLVGIDIAIGAVGLGFDFGACQSITYGSPPLRRFFGAVLFRRLDPKMCSAARYTLLRNIASVMKNRLSVFILSIFLQSIAKSSLYSVLCCL